MSYGEVCQMEQSVHTAPGMERKFWEAEKGETKLHLGCGDRKLEGYTNVDSRRDVSPDKISKAQVLSWLSDGSADLIYACHLLEHFNRVEVLKVLEEWGRVLKPYGILRLSVPDFEAVSRLYSKKGVHLRRLWGCLCGAHDYEGNVHHSTYDYQTLASLLSENGFHTIRKWVPWRVLPSEFDDLSMAEIDGEPISLNVEALRRCT